MENSLSIIIPVRNEAEGISGFLKHLLEAIAFPSGCEIILVDGESADQTVNKIITIQESTSQSHQITLLHSAPGRARQMNLGAAKANGDILYFLHADSKMPKGFDRHIKSAVSNGSAAGCFRMRFEPSNTLLEISAWFTRFNWPICRGGDQSLFIRRDVFQALNGYDENWEICEDTHLTDRIYKNYPFTVLPEIITTSARRYESRGFWKLQTQYAIIHGMRLLGYPPHVLAQWYRRHINS